MTTLAPPPSRAAIACLLDRGRDHDALDAARRRCRAVPLDAQAWTQLGRARRCLGDDPGAAEALRHALALDDGILDAWLHLATAVHQAHDPAPALAVLDQAARRFPAEATVHAHLAVLHAQRRDRPAAERAARRALDLDPAEARAHLVLARLTRQPGSRRAHLEAVLSGSAEPAIATAARFELARHLDRQGAAEVAWRLVVRGHGERRRTTAFRRCDRRALPAGLAAARAWAGSARLPTPVDPDPPGFVIGFPRSGTTLVQQMLEADPGLRTLDELPLLQRLQQALSQVVGRPVRAPHELPALTDAERAAVARTWHQLVDRLVPGPGRVIDKLPLNLPWLPLAWTIFPDAPVMLVLRDPRDVLISNLFQDYAPNDAMVHLADPAEAAALYDAVMRTWEALAAVPGVRVRAQRYEDLLGRPEAVARDMLRFFGRPWDPAVLRFHEGARQRVIATPSAEAVSEPLHRRAVARWRRHPQALQAALPVLRPWLTRYGYDEPVTAAAG